MDISDLKREIWKLYNEKSVWTQKSDADKFKKLLDELDNVNKVVLPKNIVDWIKEASQPAALDTVAVMHSDAIKYGKHIDWFRKPDNKRLLLKALLYGYEVEKEKKYRVRVKGISTNQKNLLRYHTSLKTFELAGVSTNAKNFKTEFTKQWIKDNWAGFNTYNNAGLLEFEEVED